MNTKLIAFDLDHTLAELGKGVLPEDVELLRRIEQQGVRLAICSGKPTYYLCGFARQLELEQPILVGENGAVIQIGVDLPPKEFYIQPYSQQAAESIAYLRERLKKLLPDMWYQPNMVGLTPFPIGEEQFSLVQHCIDGCGERLQDVVIYRHVDSFDITPVGIDKHTGMAYLGRILGIRPEETIAVGDGVNDYPMFEYAGFSVGVHVKEPQRVNVSFQTSTAALRFLLERCGD